MSTIVVTGASGALGSVVCARLEKAGASVFRIDRKVADLTDEAQVERAFDRAGALRGSVHCAGGWAAGSDALAFDKMIALNLRSALLCCNAAAKRMDAGGRIVNVAAWTAASSSGLAGSIAYNAAKAGVIALTKAFAEKGPARCNCVAPAAMTTPGNPPSPALVPVEEVAEAIVFLLSEAAPNGAVLTFPPRA
ncbi:MAG TPA: SDR family NAD(P)-dependent oxidoreductase [Myxococcales bacterium]|nr:SDR family NAD(P)-dependent oxidoreductase [Myxococcales bacterium]